MPHLTLVGTSDDGDRLLLVDDAGAEFTLAVDGRLRAALRGETSRLGQLEITMESTLRPRDIQARIRGGETPEAVALAAQTTVERIMAFAGPVIAERQHVAQRAQHSSLRRRGDTAGARTLGEAVETHLRSLQVDPRTVEWDAWRREDGRWTLTAAYRTTRREGTASFSYDAPGSYVTLDDDDARWLVGDQVEAPRTRGSSDDDLSAARARRRATGAGEDELPLGDDAIELVSDPATAADPGTPAPAADPAPAEPGVASEEDPTSASEDDEAPRRPVAKRRGRASVPSWDEIMFGGRDQ